MNSRTRAWTRLGELTGWGQEGIDYVYSTTDLINRRIQVVLDEQRQKQGREMYDYSVHQVSLVEKKNRMIIIKEKELKESIIKQKKINEDKCAICHDKFHEETRTNTSVGNDILTLDCNHTFHHSCIRSMLFVYMDDKCPLCRREFEYEFNACRKTKLRLKNKIIKHYSNESNRIEICKLLDLAYFLSKKNITLNFLNNFIDNISDLHPIIFLELKYCELYNNSICLFPTEHGNKSHIFNCRQHCSCSR